MGRYFTIHFKDTDKGKAMKYQMSGFPNGTPFIYAPIYIDESTNTFVCWCDKNEIDVNMIHHLEDNDVELMATDIVERIDINNVIEELGQQCGTITRDNQIINDYLFNIFNKYTCLSV